MKTFSRPWRSICCQRPSSKMHQTHKSAAVLGNAIAFKRKWCFWKAHKISYKIASSEVSIITTQPLCSREEPYNTLIENTKLQTTCPKIVFPAYYHCIYKHRKIYYHKYLFLGIRKYDKGLSSRRSGQSSFPTKIPATPQINPLPPSKNLCRTLLCIWILQRSC